jgi:hypothetical protein
MQKIGEDRTPVLENLQMRYFTGPRRSKASKTFDITPLKPRKFSINAFLTLCPPLCERPVEGSKDGGFLLPGRCMDEHVCVRLRCLAWKSLTIEAHFLAGWHLENQPGDGKCPVSGGA